MSPMRALKPCVYPGCTELVQSGSLCAVHRRKREQERGSASARGYDYAWQRVRVAYLQKHPLCCDPFGDHVGVQVRAVHVDHVVARSKGGTDAESNLQGLCSRCHSKKTVMYDGGFGNAVRMVQGEGGQNV